MKTRADKRRFCGEYEVCKDYSSTAAAVPLPSQGKVKVATDYFICNSKIFMTSDAKNIRFTVFKWLFSKIADTIYLPFFEYHIMLEQP